MLNPKLKLLAPSILWLLVILILSGYPGHKVPKVPVWQFDKLVHSSVYAILSICILIPFHKQFLDKNTRLKTSVVVVLVGVFYGGLMEILQNSIFINRSGNWYDFIANAFGAVLGVFIYSIMIKYLPIKRWFEIK